MDNDICVRCHLPFRNVRIDRGFDSEVRIMCGNQGPYHAGCMNPPPSFGCICPPGANLECLNQLCPRKATVGPGPATNSATT